MSDRPHFLRLLDHQPVADALALALMVYSEHDLNDFVFRKPRAKETASARSLAGTCRKAYEALAPYLFHRVRVGFRHPDLMSSLPPIAIANIRILSVPSFDVFSEDNRFIRFAQNLDRLTILVLTHPFTIASSPKSLNGLTFPHVQRLSIAGCNFYQLAEIIRACPDARDIAYPYLPGSEGVSMTSASPHSTVRDHHMTFGRYDHLTTRSEQLAFWRLGMVGEAISICCWHAIQPSFIRDLLQRMLRTHSTSRQILLIHQGEFTSATDIGLQNAGTIAGIWPRGLERLAVVQQQEGRDFPSGKTTRCRHVVFSVTKPDGEEGQVNVEKRMYDWIPAERARLNVGSWAGDAWSRLLDIEAGEELQ